MIKQLEADEITAKASQVFDDAIELASQSINLDALAAYKSGKLEVQDLASQAIGEVAAPGLVSVGGMPVPAPVARACSFSH